MRISSRRRRARQDGFQLVELAVALVIVGIMLAAAVPSFRQGNSWRRVQGAGREMSSRVSMARQKAILRRTSYRMNLDRSAMTYSFERQEDDSSWVSDPDQVYQIEGCQEVTSEIGGSTTADQIVFEVQGTIEAEDAPAEIALANERGDVATVAVVRTGRVTLRMSAAD